MNYKNILLAVIAAGIIFQSCKKKEDTTIPPVQNEPMLVFKFRFDSTQARLNNFGQPSSMTAGHAGQSPRFNKMSAHYIELAKDSLTALDAGEVLYRADETNAGGSNAIDFSKSTLAGNNEVFFFIPISQLAHGTYKWLRVSLAYQNYDITYQTSFVPGTNLTGTIASFIGFNTYITSFKIKDSTLVENANKLQGFWAFETSASGFGLTSQGQAPPGATTVPNPIALSSPIPVGSCVVTGAFTTPLTITGSETQDINITVSLSTNKSFEWIDSNANGIYEPTDGDTVTDMGVRGLVPIVQ